MEDNINMKEAFIKIKICTLGRPSFDKLAIDGQTFSTKLKEINIKLPFDDYEHDSGQKVCKYKLFRSQQKNEVNGIFVVYTGLNIGYCFIDNIGITFEFLFLEANKTIKDFLESKFTALISQGDNSNDDIPLSPNKGNTEDRANILLINFSPFTKILKNNEEIIDFWKIFDGIDGFQYKNSYQICFHNDNFKSFAYKKVNEIKKLDIEEIYNDNNKKSDYLYGLIVEGIQKGNNKKIETFKKEAEDNIIQYKNIVIRKYLYGENILKKYLNKEEYLDFIYKTFLIIRFYEMLSIDKPKLKYLQFVLDDLAQKQKKIFEDQQLEIFEKIFLVIDIFTFEPIKYEGNELNYIKIMNIEKNSPLNYAFDFLNNFIEELDCESNFYYPLLLVDGGHFNYKHKFGNNFKYISSYGFNLQSIDEIKTHLKNMLPKVILYTSNLGDNQALTNPINGNVIINISNFEEKEINIDKNNEDDEKSSHYGFVLSKILMHEFFGHKKSSFSKSEINYNSVISYNDKFGKLRLISNDDSIIFKQNDDFESIESFDNIVGDSGYFIEYYFGKIYEEYTISLIDNIENKTNLGMLLTPSLWHKNIKLFQEYIKLKTILVTRLSNETYDKKLNINEEILEMKKLILSKKSRHENIFILDEKLKQYEDNCYIDEQFRDIITSLKSRKAMDKKRNIPNLKGKFDRAFEKKSILFEGFTNGFYRK